MSEFDFETCNARLETTINRMEKESTRYTQYVYLHNCKTPGCVLGHHASYNLDRWQILSYEPRLIAHPSLTPLVCAQAEFGLTLDEAQALFDVDGCAHARCSLQQATAYVRLFLSRRRTLGRQLRNDELYGIDNTIKAAFSNAAA